MTASAPVAWSGSVDPARPWLPWRRGIARVLYSPGGRFRTVVFASGDRKRVGRDERADVAIADPALRGAHFELYFDGLRFHVEDLSGQRSVAIDGRPARFGEIHSGGFVAAGGTTIGLYLERATPPAVDLAPEPSAAAALAELAPLREAGALFAVLDRARDPRIKVLLDEGIDEHASLYEGADGAALDDVAPYLVRFAPDSQLLERVVGEGWGRAWGLFAHAAMGFREVRRHFRRFLMVADDDTDERLYFRFYDPRVLREFDAVATVRQRDELLGDLGELLLEDRDGGVLRLHRGHGEPATRGDA